MKRGKDKPTLVGDVNPSPLGDGAHALSFPRGQPDAGLTVIVRQVGLYGRTCYRVKRYL